jgi:hypothetical protein
VDPAGRDDLVSGLQQLDQPQEVFDLAPLAAALRHDPHEPEQDEQDDEDAESD